MPDATQRNADVNVTGEMVVTESKHICLTISALTYRRLQVAHLRSLSSKDKSLEVIAEDMLCRGLDTLDGVSRQLPVCLGLDCPL